MNKDQVDPYTHGTGYGHMAVCSENIEVFREKLIQLDFNPGEIKSLMSGGVTAARFFFVRDPDGYQIEVLEKSGHYV